jgi:hypothetical protein
VLRLTAFCVFVSIFSGCQPAGRESSFSSQISAVQAGKSDRILIEHSPLTDNDLAQLADLTALRELLIDHPESTIKAAGIEHLAGLPNLQHLRIRASGIDDEALAAIARLPSLTILNLPQADLTDAGLVPLRDLPNLVQLRFGSPRVTDAGIQTVAQLPGLRRLHLIDVPISPLGLTELARAKQLESLYIDGANLPDAALEELFRQRPDLHVHLDQEHHDRDPHGHAH